MFSSCMKLVSNFISLSRFTYKFAAYNQSLTWTGLLATEWNMLLKKHKQLDNQQERVNAYTSAKDSKDSWQQIVIYVCECLN